MKENKDILNEAFLKKQSYNDRLQKKLPQYAPVSASQMSGSSSRNMDSGIFAVNDVGEMKKLLTKTYGAAFGDNNIKAMAGKAIKTFPIIISDNVEPETALAIKKLVEEQYADYINLLVSNKVIDIGAYSTASPDGSNIAIQALDTLSGNDFSKNRVANKAMNTGEITSDDIFANIPLFQLMRENAMEIKTGNKLVDTLLENAVVVPEKNVQDVANYITENAEEIIPLSEAMQKDPPDYPTYRETTEDEDDEEEHSRQSSSRPSSRERNREPLDVALDRYMGTGKPTESDYMAATAAINAKDIADMSLTGFRGFKDGKALYTKLSNTDIVVDKGQFDMVMNRTVGELLEDPKNAPLKDKFVKASILLQSEMITGSEFIDYCTMRLGIPISQQARAELVTRFKRAKSINRNNRNYQDNIFMTNKEMKTISKNQKHYSKVARLILGVQAKDIVKAASIATSSGAIAGTTAALIPGVLELLGVFPIIGIAVAGAAIGGGAYFLYKALRRKTAKTKVEGWERVESLIDMMDRQRADIIAQANYKDAKPGHLSSNIYNTVSDTSSLKHGTNSLANYEKTMDRIDNLEKPKDDDPLTPEQMDMIKKMVSDQVNGAITLAEQVHVPATSFIISSQDYINRKLNDLNETCDSLANDPEYQAQCLEESILSEKTIKTTMPMKVYNINKKPNKDVLVVPEFGAKSVYAYGSAEVDPKVVKDRKYDQPLLMTIRFKNRFDDGRTSDSELTAVIGILGKVIRVPSDEMKYILESNAEGRSTTSGLFKNIDVKNMAADLLNASKINKDIKSLPKSAEIWQNLEKIATLAVANSMTGKKTGNVANAHIVFSQNEIDAVRISDGYDYKKDMDLAEKLLKRYSAFELMIADDPAQRLYMYNGVDDISWDIVPYHAIFGKDTGDQLVSALARLGR